MTRFSHFISQSYFVRNPTLAPQLEKTYETPQSSGDEGLHFLHCLDRKATLTQVSIPLVSVVASGTVPRQMWVSGASQAGLEHLEGLCDPGQWKGCSWCSWHMVYRFTQFLLHPPNTHMHTSLFCRSVSTPRGPHTPCSLR